MSNSFFQMNSISLIEWEEFWKTFIKLIFTTHKRSCEKVMFSQASVCLQWFSVQIGVGLRAALGGFLPKGWGFSVTEKCILPIKKSKREFQLPLMHFNIYMSWIIVLQGNIPGRCVPPITHHRYFSNQLLDVNKGFMRSRGKLLR